MIVLFDLDGTLVDTENLAISVTEKYFNRHGIEVRTSDLEILVGHTWSESVAILSKQYPIEKLNELVEQELLQDYREQLAISVPTLPGSREAVLNLAQEFRLALVSGSRRHDIELILKTLSLWEIFEVVVGFEDYAKSKPNPEPYLTALKKMGASTKNAIAFEDSSAGIKAAQAAGLPVVRVGNSTTTTGAMPSTQWHIENLLSINCQWVKEKFKP
jgi:beta-phosphoglucomutase